MMIPMTYVNPTIGNLSFLYWERDGIILRGAGGVPLRDIRKPMWVGKTLTAKFLNSVPIQMAGCRIGSIEGRWAIQSTDDTDGDGYSLQTEHKYGFSNSGRYQKAGGFSKSASSMLTIHAQKVCHLASISMRMELRMFTTLIRMGMDRRMRRNSTMVRSRRL